jgi:hypothetical protein
MVNTVAYGVRVRYNPLISVRYTLQRPAHQVR